MILPDQNDVAQQLQSVRLWTDYLKDVGGLISPRFGRIEVWLRARAYLQALLGSVERARSEARQSRLATR